MAYTILRKSRQIESYLIVWLFCCVLGFLLVFSSKNAISSDLVDISQYVTITTANEKTTLDRATRILTSTADVIITNTSGNVIKLPVRAIINITGTDYTNVTMPEAQGGPGTQPYGKYFYEKTPVSMEFFVTNYGRSDCNTDCLGDLDGDGDVDGIDLEKLSKGSELHPGENLTFHLKFVRKDDILFQYYIEPYGIIEGISTNKPPVADAGEDKTVVLPAWENSIVVTLDGSKSFDPDGDIVSYLWTCIESNGNSAPDPPDILYPQVKLSPGVYIFKLVVTDDNGASSIPDTATVTVVSREFNPPLLSISPMECTLKEGEEATINVTATDVNGRNVTLGAYPAITNSTFTTEPGPEATGTFIFKPDYGQQGIYTVAFRATNDLGLTSIKTVNIRVENVNRAPTIDSLNPVVVDEGKAITLHVSSDDPDGDPVIITASNLPDRNAIFIPSSSTFIFAPDFDQAGTYTITFVANDGKSSSEPVTLTVEVKDVPTGENGGLPSLVLQVDPVESPTLRPIQTITGRVNSSGGSVKPVSIKTSLITGLSPSTVEQGQTVDVQVTGQATGSFETHFEEGVTTANLGEGIIVNSVSVDDSHHAILNITIAPDAPTGQRTVVLNTGSETAVSTVAFNVMTGRSTISGRVLSPGDGSPLSDVTVSIQGTTLSVKTDSKGNFTLSDVPTGKWRLLVNSPNHELVTVSFNITAAKEVDLGTFEPKSLVYQPGNEPSVSLRSILGRGITDFTSIKTLEEAKDLVRDTYLFLGGADIGVLDEYGNQLNPKVKEVPYVSITEEGIEETAESLITGETTSLGELLFSFTYLWDWNGQRPNLIEWLHAIQNAVNRAWQNPDDPESALFIILFNQGKHLSPDPPQIVADTPLNALQAQVMSMTLFITASKSLDPSWVNQQILERSTE